MQFFNIKQSQIFVSIPDYIEKLRFFKKSDRSNSKRVIFLLRFHRNIEIKMTSIGGTNEVHLA